MPAVLNARGVYMPAVVRAATVNSAEYCPPTRGKPLRYLRAWEDTGSSEKPLAV